MKKNSFPLATCRAPIVKPAGPAVILWRRNHVKILVIEDDAETAEYVGRGLEQEGHVVDRATNGEDGLFLAGSEPYDLMIIDRMLPGLDGLTIVKRIRRASVHTPVLFLTTRSGIEDRVAGLDAGGDDYLVKPFAFAELVARVAALGRRPRTALFGRTLKVGDLELDQASRVVTRGGRLIELRPREYRLLEYLMQHEGQVVTRTMLLQHVWDFNFDPRTTVVEMHISRLRSKVDKSFDTELIHTVRGAGYCIRASR
jgi:two-component system, OmpR family, response regulator